MSKNTGSPIILRKYPSGKTAYMVRMMVNGEHFRKSFPTKAEAQTFLAQLKVQRQNLAEVTLSANLRAEAVRCHRLLNPYGVTLTEAAQYYLKHVVAYREAPTIREIVSRMISEARSNGRRDRTIDELEQRLGKFADAFGERQLLSLTVDELQAWLNDPGWSAQTRRNYATKVSQVFNYAIRRGWTETNLVKRIARPNGEDKEPGIFTVEEAESLLRYAKKYDLLPYVCLGLFAGLRSNELARLDWQAVRLQDRSIVVGAGVAKKRSRRVVPLNDTLAAWLGFCEVQASGPIVDQTNFRWRMAKLAAEAVGKWRHNGLRHSFGSYHLAIHGNEMETARQMGHRSADIVHNHYKALVSKSDAERFWALRPAYEEAGRVIPFVRTEAMTGTFGA